MKRLLSLILALMLCFSLLAGCDGYSYDDDDDDDDDDKKSSFFGKDEEEDDKKSDSQVETTAPVSDPTTAAPSTETAAPSTGAPVTEQPTIKTPKQIYTDYLVNGGYNQLTGENVNNSWRVETCQIDLDEDGTPELLINLINEEYLGVRGYPSYGYLLAIRNGNVVKLLESHYSGGSMGGDYLRIRQNEMTGRQVISRDGYWRAGADSYMNLLEVYAYNGGSLYTTFSATDGFLFLPTMESDIKEIQAKTDIYELNGDEFYYWIADGQYVTRENHSAACSPYPMLQYNAMVTGTLSNPLNI